MTRLSAGRGLIRSRDNQSHGRSLVKSHVEIFGAVEEDMERLKRRVCTRVANPNLNETSSLRDAPQATSELIGRKRWLISRAHRSLSLSDDDFAGKPGAMAGIARVAWSKRTAVSTLQLNRTSLRA